MARRPDSSVQSAARLSLAGLLFALAAQAQDRIPPDGQALRIARIADIPPRLLPAIRQADCRLGEAMLSTFPIEIFRPAAGSHPMAIVPCAGITLYGRAFLFDPDAASTPRPLAFPVMAFAGRLSMSETPGALTWNPDAKTLVAIQGNDVCDGMVARHTYRHDGGDLNGFSLAKVERGRLGCGAGENWQVIWQK